MRDTRVINAEMATAIRERDSSIMSMLRDGVSMAAAGRCAGISRERVRQIRRREERRAEG